MLGVAALVERGAEEQVPGQLVVARTASRRSSTASGSASGWAEQQAVARSRPAGEVVRVQLERALEPARGLVGQAEVRRDAAPARRARGTSRGRPRRRSAAARRPSRGSARRGAARRSRSPRSCARGARSKTRSVKAGKCRAARPRAPRQPSRSPVMRRTPHQARDEQRRVAELAPGVLVAQQRERPARSGAGRDGMSSMPTYSVPMLKCVKAARGFALELAAAAASRLRSCLSRSSMRALR